MIDTDDLVDADGVAKLLGLAQRNTVSGYQRRYQDMPRPVMYFANGHVPVWSRSAIESWISIRGTIHIGRPRKSATLEDHSRAADPLTKPRSKPAAQPKRNTPP